MLAFLAEQDQQTFGPLSVACRGGGVAGAAAYAPGSPAKTVYLERSAETYIPTTVVVPSAQRAGGVAETAVVACGADDTEREVLGRCCFSRTLLGVGVGGEELCYPRVRLTREVVFHEARTGRELGRYRVRGDEPRACDDYVGRRPTEGQFVGPEPDLEDFETYMRNPEGPHDRAPASSSDAAVPIPPKLDATGGK